MLPFYKKYWRTAFDIALIALTVYLILFVSSRLYHIAAPVFLSLLVFWCIEPLARYLNKKGMHKPFASAISVVLFITLLLALFFGLGLIVVTQLAKLVDNLPQYTSIAKQAFGNITSFLQHKIANLPTSITQNINDYFDTVTKLASTWGASVLQQIIFFLGSFSTFITNFGVAIILAFFLSMEINLWKVIVRKKTPHSLKTALSFFRNHVLKAIGSYIKAQLILVSITFIIIFLGISILGISNAFTIAVIAAVFDILPLLGVPVIFIPWAIYLFVIGDTGLAIELLVLLTVAMLVRQLSEPKIAGNSIGVTSAYVMLSFMFISLSIFGVAGLILSPILIILIKELWQQGYLQKWIHFPKEEFEEPPFLVKLQEEEASPSEEASKSIT